MRKPRNWNVSPFTLGKPAWLEEIIQPLYHRESLAVGGGTVTARRYFTSPTAVTPVDITPQLSASNGQIPTPKIFVIHGIRTAFSEDIASQTDRVEDLVTLLWSMSFQLFIGERTYLWAPLWLVPAGGVGVKFYRDQGGIIAATDTAVAQSGGGGYFDRFSLQRIPITIPSQQLFYVELAPQDASVSITSERPTYVVLDGAFGREL